jgi:geranylgeranyl diphosphate synthase type II
VSEEDFAARWAHLRERYAVLLVDHLHLGPPLVDVAQYALAGGKRLRPLLVELVGRALGARPDALAEVAVAVEYLHTASVLLDDLPSRDGATARRGRAPAHERFSEAEAILTAVAIVSRAFAVLLAAPVETPEAGRAMVNLACETVAGTMASGQAMELRASTGGGTAGEIRSIHERKTASLFALVGSLSVAGAGANADPRVGESVVRFTTLLGRAYQIIDDIEDRDESGEGRANLARAMGVPAAEAEARALLGKARESIAGLPASDLAGCVDWLERRVGAGEP